MKDNFNDLYEDTLWEKQLCKARVWSKQHLALYLSRCAKPLALDEYFSPRHNRDIILVSSYLALASKSDCDGKLNNLLSLFKYNVQ